MCSLQHNRSAAGTQNLYFRAKRSGEPEGVRPLGRHKAAQAAAAEPRSGIKKAPGFF